MFRRSTCSIYSNCRRLLMFKLFIWELKHCPSFVSTHRLLCGLTIFIFGRLKANEGFIVVRRSIELNNDHQRIDWQVNEIDSLRLKRKLCDDGIWKTNANLQCELATQWNVSALHETKWNERKTCFKPESDQLFVGIFFILVCKFLFAKFSALQTDDLRFI